MWSPNLEATDLKVFLKRLAMNQAKWFIYYLHHPRHIVLNDSLCIKSQIIFFKFMVSWFYYKYYESALIFCTSRVPWVLPLFLALIDTEYGVSPFSILKLIFKPPNVELSSISIGSKSPPTLYNVTF